MVASSTALTFNKLNPVVVTILLLTCNEADNLRVLLPAIRRQMCELGAPYEIVIIDAHSTDSSALVATQHGARVILQRESGYGQAFKEGLENVEGQYIIALDADLSHHPQFIPALWNERDRADLVIASRFCNKGMVQERGFRYALSRLLNWAYSRTLRLHITDLSSGFRLYNTSAIRGLKLRGKAFDILEEVAVLMQQRGGVIVEVPFTYLPRGSGISKARIAGVSWRLFIMLVRLRFQQTQREVMTP